MELVEWNDIRKYGMTFNILDFDEDFWSKAIDIELEKL